MTGVPVDRRRTMFADYNPVPSLRAWFGGRPDSRTFAQAMASSARPLMYTLRVWAAVCLALYIAFWLELDNPYWASTTVVIVSQPSLGASLRKGRFYLIGTVAGAVAILLLAALFPQNRTGFLVGLALWAAVCAFASTLLRNFAGYGAALAGFTAAIIAADLLGRTGGVNGGVFNLAVARATAISVGIVCSVIVLGGTDFGSAPGRLAGAVAGVSAEIAAGFTETLRSAGADFGDIQSVRRELTRRVIALDQLIDEAIGESIQLRYREPILQGAMNGLLTALAAWRAVAVHLCQVRHERGRADARVVLRTLPPELLSAFRQDRTPYWISAPARLRESCDAAASALIAIPADEPSLRLLADQTAHFVAGVSHALEGLELLTGQRTRAIFGRGGAYHLQAPDRLPAVINGVRTFAAIGAVELFWIITAWPSGTFAIFAATVTTLLLGPRGDQAYGAAVWFIIGGFMSVVLAMIVKFAVLPQLDSFAGLCVALGAVLVPGGFALAKQWLVAVLLPTMFFFLALVGPTNPMSYDFVQFSNTAAAIIAGLAAGALAFSLIPPLSPAIRAGRLAYLTLRDLRHLATEPAASTVENWQIRLFSRLNAFPSEGSPRQLAQLVAALSAGSEIIRLHGVCRRLVSCDDLEGALGALTAGDIALATARFTSLDHALDASAIPNALRARAGIVIICEALAQYRAYFETGAAR